VQELLFVDGGFDTFDDQKSCFLKQQVLNAFSKFHSRPQSTLVAVIVILKKRNQDCVATLQRSLTKHIAPTRSNECILSTSTHAMQHCSGWLVKPCIRYTAVLGLDTVDKDSKAYGCNNNKLKVQQVVLTRTELALCRKCKHNKII